MGRPHYNRENEIPHKDPAARREYQRAANARRRDSGHKAEYRRRYYAERKAKIRALKADKACERCGFNDPRALDFHHRDPATKKFKVSADAWRRSWESILEEVAKCDVLCANCHRIEHTAHLA